MYYRLEDILHPKFVVNVDRGKKRFFLDFASVHHFERWYSTLHPAEKTMNEVVMSDKRKFIIDIDDSADTALYMFDFERHVTARIHHVFTMLDIGVPEVIVYNMIDESGDVCYNKLSYHVIVTNFLFSAATCKGLCMIVSSGQVWDKCVDTGIYKSVQCIRIEGSTKFGEKRWKYATTKKATFRQGLLSNTDDAVESEFMCNLMYGSLQNRIYAPLDMSQFKINKRTSTYVSLYRIKPGYCMQCNRIHYRENAAIRYIMGKHTFMCWRYKTLV
jgi:hypothetical protein